MPRRRKKTAAKYLVRRVIFILLLLLLLALGGLGLWKLLSPGEEQPSSGSQPEPPSSLSGANIQTGGGEVAPPESSAPPEPEQPAINREDWNLVLINPAHAIEKELEMTFDEVQGYKFDSRIAGRVRELIAAA